MKKFILKSLLYLLRHLVGLDLSLSLDVEYLEVILCCSRYLGCKEISRCLPFLQLFSNYTLSSYI
jgi:hypothetical protein